MTQKLQEGFKARVGSRPPASVFKISVITAVL